MGEPVAATLLDKYEERKAKVDDPKNPESRSCPMTDCVFRSHLRKGGKPCTLCRHLTVGDFYVKQG